MLDKRVLSLRFTSSKCIRVSLIPVDKVVVSVISIENLNIYYITSFIVKSIVYHLNLWEELNNLLTKEIVFEVLEIKIQERKDFAMIILDNISNTKNRKIIISGYYNFLCITGGVQKVDCQEIIHSSTKTTIVRGRIERINFVCIDL
jgi:hypothetical protein